ncbi:TraB/GumN family protein [uncultured Dokdonia sp.]|uniref:TraB/GumN family protein n=1 Tax=uncultured Dokdonia sp. TaxID=575653 RepID=UPI0026110A7D|nr:TraB/GumN family protein [uncultured Dokdonia sp.]
MKNTIKAFVALVLSTFSLIAQEESSLLWKVEGNGIKPSYVFGTFHLMPQDDFEFKDKVDKAMKDTDITVLELDMDDPQMMGSMQTLAQLEEGKKLSSYMDEKEYEILDTYLTEHMGVGMAAFNSFKPFTITSMITITMMGKQTASYEAEIIKRSKEGQKEVLGLETPEFQVSVFETTPYEEQIDQIIEYLQKPEKMTKEFDAMITQYKNEDIEGLHATMDESFKEDPEFKKALLDNRNNNWIGKIGELSKNQKVFYGVGAGHLGGDQGVINLLRKAGYTVTPITE